MLQNEIALVSVMISFALFFSLLPDIQKCLNTPAGHTYIPIHNNLYDYALYINYELQGLRGQTVLFDRFTTEAHDPRIVNPFYLVLGRFARMWGATNPHTVYFLARITLGILYALLIYHFLRLFLPSKLGRVFALFFILYGTSFPIINASGPSVTLSSFMDWWSELDPIMRTTFLPAHLAGHTLMLLTLMIFTRVKNNRVSIVTGGLAGFFAGLFHTPSLVLPLLLLPSWAILTKQWKLLGSSILGLSISSLSFLFLSKQFTILPWTIAWTYEQLSFAISFPEYLLALGPIVPLACVGILFGDIPKTHRILLILWIVICFGLLTSSPYLSSSTLPLLHTFPISNVRFLQMVVHIPLSILSASALLFMWKRFAKIAFFIILTVILCITFISYPTLIKKGSDMIFGDPLIQYPTVQWMDAVHWLDGKNQTNAVLSMPFAGLVIAMDTDRTVYIGRATSTINLDEKTDRAWTFFATAMPICDTFAFLRDNRIQEIFVGYDEKKAQGDLTRYPFVQLQKDVGDTQIYEFTGEQPRMCP